jgi:hypothetical protein
VTWFFDLKGHASIEMRKHARAGLVMAVAGAFLAFDPESRARLLLDVVRDWWYWAAAILAVALVMRAITDRPTLVLSIAFAGLAVIGIWGIDLTAWRSAAQALPMLACAVGVATVFAGTRSSREKHAKYTSILWVRRLSFARGTMQPQTDLVCVAGGLQIDLRSTSLAEEARLCIRLLAGEMTITIPREWRCQLESAHLAYSAVREEGPLPDTGPSLILDVAITAGVLVVRRS